MSRAATMLLMALAACQSPIQDIKNRGGTTPVACIADIKGYGPHVVTCRDGRGTIWACSNTGDDADCTPIDVLRNAWELPRAEAVAR